MFINTKHTAHYLIIAFLVISFSKIYSQDSHYWYKQFGTEGELLGGSVIGGIKDLSSTYYNPGVMALTRDTTVLLGVDAIEFIWINAKDGAGIGKDLKTTFVRASPGIIALRLPLEGLGNNSIAISYLVRQDIDYDVAAVRDDKYSDSKTNYVSGEVLNSSRLSEIWLGLSWAYQISKTFGIGITNYVPIRSQRSRLQTIIQTIDDELSSSSVIAYNDFNYYNVRLLWKLGFVFDYNPFTFGLSLTTPSINLFGNGDVKRHFGTAINSPEISLEYLASNNQKDLATLYKSPFSIGAGVTYTFDKTSLYFSAEWFDKVNLFNVMDAEDFRSQSNGDTLSYNLSHQFKSVFNFGVGIKQSISENYTFYGGITTDRSANVEDYYSPFNLSTWNLIHFTAGGSFHIGNLDLTLGLGLAASSDYFERIIVLDDKVGDVGKVQFSRLKIIVGFSYKL